jgi:hypothetical protein
MRRRDFIAGLGGAVAWPLAARAQQPNRMRRVGVLLSGTENDLVVQALWAASREALGKLGWIEGSNVRFDVRFIATDPDRMRAHAEELVRLAPDVILAVSLSATKAVQQQTRTIPIVFVNVGDPVAGGLRTPAEVAHAIPAFAEQPNGGLVVMPGVPVPILIYKLAVEYKLPSIGSGREDAANGALLSYGSNRISMFRDAATYV